MMDVLRRMLGQDLVFRAPPVTDISPPRTRAERPHIDREGRIRLQAELERVAAERDREAVLAQSRAALLAAVVAPHSSPAEAALVQSQIRRHLRETTRA